MVTDTGTLPLAIPRDRVSSFAPQLVPKGVRRLPGFDQKVLSLYARGLTVRELQAHLEECYQVPVSPSAVTDEILPELQAWQQQSLYRYAAQGAQDPGHFPTEEAAGKLLYLALRNAVVRLGAPKDWHVAIATHHPALWRSCPTGRVITRARTRTNGHSPVFDDRREGPSSHSLLGMR